MTADLPWAELTWADQLIMRGVLLRQLRRRFGEVPELLAARIQTADGATLEEMLDRVVTVNTLEEFQRERDH